MPRSAASAQRPGKSNNMKRLHSVLDGSIGRAALLALTLFAVGACATPPTDPAARAEFEKTNDPFEPLNRKIFDFNLFVDRVALKPVAKAYVAVIPQVGRDAIRNFLDNLDQPIVFANNLLQGQFMRAHNTFARFLTNTTLGLGGVIDIATKAGVPKETGDFGQTLYSWGVPDGPYLVLPIFGPSDPRDAVGKGVDGFADPWNRMATNYHYWYMGLIRGAVDGIDQRARNLQTLDELQRNAIDFYAELRSLWRQHRASELRHGEPAPIPELDSLYRDPAPQQPSHVTTSQVTAK
jgi:phospholipid-binding lipoprotein MlaA